MVKIGQTVNFVDERGSKWKALVLEIRTQGPGKKEILNLQYSNGGLKKVHGIMHETERPLQADETKILYWN